MILSIESSCDDSSIAITRIATRELIFHKKISQELEHARYGGVVPELASRLHAEALPMILEECTPWLDQLKAVAVTTEPGLGVTLVEGLMMAKALSLALHIPVLPINHLKGHIYSLFIGQEAQLPLVVLLVSGGHTQLIEMEDSQTVRTVATTMDDSFGESFDKVAKMMGLGYPGGPIIESLAAQSEGENRYHFSVPLAQSPLLAFSYSGLKNQVRLAIEAASPEAYPDIARAFQDAAIAHLIQKVKKYLKTAQPKQFAIVGGASANGVLRAQMEALLAPRQIALMLAPLSYCADNAAMIGRYALELYEHGTWEHEAIVRPRSKL